MNNEKFNVKLQNPPLIVMLCLLISLVFLFKSLDLLSQIIGLILLLLYFLFFIYKLIWFIRYRKKFFVMELSERSIKIADNEYNFEDIDKVIFFENYLQIKYKKKRWKLIYFIINIEDKSKLTSCIKGIIKEKNVRITLK